MIKKFTESVNHAVDGIIYAFKTERNLKIHFVATLMVLALCLMLDLTTLELAMIFFAITLVIVSEMFNTAMEAFVNLLTLSHHPLAKIAKDVSAGGVLIAAVNSVAIAYLLIISPLRNRQAVFLTVFNNIKGSWLHVLIIIFCIIIVGVMVGKTLGGRGRFLQGGLVSGHAAVAFSTSTVILLITKNVFATTLAFFLAILVAQSRVEGNIHKWVEVVLGAFLGIATSLLVYYVLYIVQIN